MKQNQISFHGTYMEYISMAFKIEISQFFD